MDVSNLSRDERLELYQLLQEKSRRLKFNRINGLFPDEGPLRRAMYPKHVEFFRAGLTKIERLFLPSSLSG